MPDGTIQDSDSDPFEPRNTELCKPVGREIFMRSVFKTKGLSDGLRDQ